MLNSINIYTPVGLTLKASGLKGLLMNIISHELLNTSSLSVFVPVINKINKHSAVVKINYDDYIKYDVKGNLRIKNGYAYHKKYKDYLHRVITEYKYEIVDHANRNRLDCTRSNLRRSNYSLNKANSKPHNKRRYKGVRKSFNKYRATIVYNGKQIHLGMHNNEEEAAIAYNNAALIYYGDHAELNNV